MLESRTLFPFGNPKFLVPLVNLFIEISITGLPKGRRFGSCRTDAMFFYRFGFCALIQ